MQKPRTEARLVAKEKEPRFFAALVRPNDRVLKLIIQNWRASVKRTSTTPFLMSLTGGEGPTR